ncbi:hypothetical protein ACVWXM_008527 [Bradyrhizobium sp. GM7.3]
MRSSEEACCSRSCAAPRMPESGFLISCASIAASAITERAALRWVSWRSILSAMERSWSITTIWPGRSVTGATCRSTWRSPPMRGVPRSTLYSLTGAFDERTWSISASKGLPNGTSSFSDCRFKNCVEISKKASVAMLAATILPSGPIMSTGLGSASRMASLSDGNGRRCSATELMQRRSMRSRRRHLAVTGERGADPPR